MTPNVWKMFTNPPRTLTFCPYLSWLNNLLFMANFQLTRMSSYAKNKLQMCSVTQHRCRRRQMCGNVHTLIHYTHFGLLQKMTCLHWTIYLWKGFYLIGCPLRTNYRCVQSLNISVDVAKCVENVHKFTQFTHFLSVTKNDLSWLNNLFMARFQLIRCPLMLRTNYRCVQSLNISVDDAKCVENVHKFTKYTFCPFTFCSMTDVFKV